MSRSTPMCRTVVADPPWPFVWHGGPGGRRRNGTTLGYETMSYEAIRDLFPWPEQPGLLNPRPWAINATLFLWVTQEALHSGCAQRVAGAWGFGTRVGEIIWRKPNFGAGAFPRIGHETCLIYRAGTGSLKPDAPRNVHSVQTWSQRYDTNHGKTNGAKPDGFYDLVEQGHLEPYAELFSRRARFGWEYPIGDQALGGIAA